MTSAANSISDEPNCFQVLFVHHPLKNMGKNKANKSKKVSKSRSVNQPGYWISNTLDQPLANGTKKPSIEEVPNNSDDISLSPLDGITKSPGLAHISEQILMNLDQRDIKKCKNVNESWKGIVTNPADFKFLGLIGCLRMTL